LKTVFSSLNLVEVHHLKNLFQSAGIRCRIKNEDLVRLAGEIPFPECTLQLVIEREDDAPAAEALLEARRSCGLAGDPSDIPSLRETLYARALEISASAGGKKVEFLVSVEGGKPKVKAVLR